VGFWALPCCFLLVVLICVWIICGEQARVVAAATISVMLEGPVRAFLQVAEYRQLAQKAPFTTLSGTLGQIVIQLHTGIPSWLHLSI
jgi:hypothetical protein